MNTVWLVVLVVICVGVGLWLASLIVEALRRPPEAIRDRQFCLASGCGRILPPSLARRTSIETPLRIDSNWIVDGIEAAGCMPKIVNSVSFIPSRQVPRNMSLSCHQHLDAGCAVAARGRPCGPPARVGKRTLESAGLRISSANRNCLPACSRLKLQCWQFRRPGKVDIKAPVLGQRCVDGDKQP
jgi:hypothetical protein